MRLYRKSYTSPFGKKHHKFGMKRASRQLYGLAGHKHVIVDFPNKFHAQQRKSMFFCFFYLFISRNSTWQGDWVTWSAMKRLSVGPALTRNARHVFFVVVFVGTFIRFPRTFLVLFDSLASLYAMVLPLLRAVHQLWTSRFSPPPPPQHQLSSDRSSARDDDDDDDDERE